MNLLIFCIFLALGFGLHQGWRWLQQPVPPSVHFDKLSYSEHFWRVTVDDVEGYEDIWFDGHDWFLNFRIRRAASLIRRRAGIGGKTK